MAEPVAHVGYLELIRTNTSFRRLWIGNVVSLFGDWFHTIALYSLILDLTGSEFALGAVFVTKMLPWAIASPIAGLLVDRFDRRKVMIWSDLLRAVIVLAFLMIDEPSEVPLVYVIITAQVLVGSVFQPAQSASIPNITGREALVTANTIMSATWSLLLTLGAAAGGIAAEVLGLQAVFVLDSVSYVVSAFFIWRTVIPQQKEVPEPGPVVRTAIREVVDGWNHLRERPRIYRMALAKTTWTIAGGGLVYMLALMGESISPDRQSLAIGILFAARGFGTGIGPIAARSLFKTPTTWPSLLGMCVIVSGIGYAVAGAMPWTYLVVVPVALAHATSGANWVLSTVLLQERTADRYRGRVFATEWLLTMGANSGSILLASFVLEMGLFSLRETVLVFAGLQVFSGVVWLLTVVPGEKRDDEAVFPG